MATPLMEQYAEVKKRHPDEILMFRLGDFYEMFYEDAKTASRTLGITLTSRFKGDKAVPMAGVPHHTSEMYINRLLKAGLKVAVCDQLEDPADADGLIERDVTRIITPGTITEESILSEKSHNFLAAICVSGRETGLAWADLSTGSFAIEDLHIKEITDELTRISPAELLVPESLIQSNPALAGDLKASCRCLVTPAQDWTFERDNALKTLNEHFGTANLSGFGCDNAGLAVSAAGAIMEYLKQTQKTNLVHINRLEQFHKEDSVYLDRTTQISLELVRSMKTGEVEGTLLSVLDRTSTPMGARLIRDWITAPLKNPARINERLDAVGEFLAGHQVRKDVRLKLRDIFDLERISAKLGASRANPRDLLGLRQTLERIPDLKKTLGAFSSPLARRLAEELDPISELTELIARAISDEPPILIKEGGIFRPGYAPEIDELLSIKREGKSWMARFQAAEIARTGISTLKVGFNQIFGYYIEVTNANQEKIPADYTRKQTLKNAERYITQELKEYEAKVLNAEENLKKLEYGLFLKLREQAAMHIPAIQRNAAALAAVDVLAGLAETAFENKYARPVVDDSGVLSIMDGRHPVIECALKGKFVPNDTLLDGEANRLIMITGPNMAGKSTYIRQVALIALMAQAGSFVPAKEARIGAVDRIFTRVGASDELTRGASTFMVEMNETANILNNATGRSLVVLDEIGRGTSTFDGVSIAWAVAEYIHDRIGARTLFATHYHELTELELVLPGVKNFHVSVKEWGEKIVFVHKIKPGGTDKSYGVHVARLAGIPQTLIDRAKEILTELESLTLDEHNKPKFSKTPGPTRSPQLLLFQPPNPVLEALKDIDPDNVTPMQAINKLKQLKDMLGRKIT